MKKTGVLFLVFLLALTLFVCIYIFVFGFLDKREYTRSSLEYYFLTSQELRDLSQHCEDSPRFVYWPGDNSPITVKLYCTYDLALFEAYIKQNHFKPEQTFVDGRITEGYFVKEGKTIRREISHNKVVVTITYDDALPVLQKGVNIFGAWITIF